MLFSFLSKRLSISSTRHSLEVPFVGRQVAGLRLAIADRCLSGNFGEHSQFQTDLGKKVGISFQQIQKYETGGNRVGAGRLQRIAEVLDVPVSFFFEGARGSSDEAENINSGLRFLETAAAVRVVRAFAEIEDRQVRQAIIIDRGDCEYAARSRKEADMKNPAQGAGLESWSVQGRVRNLR